MPTGAILRRELLTAARRPGTYRRRCVLAGSIWLVLGMILYVLHAAPRAEPSISAIARGAKLLFGLTMQVQMALTVWLVPTFVATLIAEQRERGTLESVLMTPLSSAAVVLGLLGAGLVQYAGCLATGLPILILLPLLGGIDPAWVLLAYAATASTAFFLGGLSILVSTGARRAGRAVAATICLTTVWCSVPILVHFVLPRTYPRLSPWVYPVNEWLLASSPAGVLIALMGAGPGWRLLDSIYWMIGLQIASGSLLIAGAVARFRSSCRAAAEGAEAPRSARLRWRFLGRPACGENPVLWKELHTARARGWAGLAGRLCAAGMLALIGYGTYRLARPAFLEWFENGLGPPSSDIHQRDFNFFLRHITSWVEFFTLLIAAGVAAEGVTAERARGTWDGLIATSLGGREILRAKMLGAAWKVRWGAIALVALWSVGLLTGSLHPVGFAAALLLLGAAVWFMTALGTFMSLVSRDTAQASNRTLIPVLLLSASFLIYWLPGPIRTVLLGVGSAPFVNWLVLLCQAEFRDVTLGQEVFSTLRELDPSTAESPQRVLAAWLLSATGLTASAAWLGRLAVAHLERPSGRPEPVAESINARQSIQGCPDRAAVAKVNP